LKKDRKKGEGERKIDFFFKEGQSKVGGGRNHTLLMFYPGKRKGGKGRQEQILHRFKEPVQRGEVRDWSCGGTRGKIKKELQ